ncbi:MAG: ABC transporter permease [Armatimonadota bacterium]
MGRYFARRFLLSLPVLVGVTVVTFSLMYLIPGDPAVLLAGPTANLDEITALRSRLGLDRPPVFRYLDYMARLVRFDFGTSLRTKEPVAFEIKARLPNTLLLASIAITLAALFGVAMGILAASRHLSSIDSLTMVFSLLGVSMPSFWLGLLLILVFAEYLQWFPVAGRGDWRFLVLPSITLAARALGEIARMSRADMLEILREDFIRTAHAKGLGELKVLVKHALRNAAIPTVTVVGLRFGTLLSGAVLTETIFAWPGVGRLMVDAISVRDFPVIQGTILVTAVVFILINLLVDLTYAWLDPRIRYQ